MDEVTEEYLKLKKEIGLTNPKLGEVLGLSKRAVERYNTGQVIPIKAILMAMKYHLLTS